MSERQSCPRRGVRVSGTLGHARLARPPPRSPASRMPAAALRAPHFILDRVPRSQSQPLTLCSPLGPGSRGTWGRPRPPSAPVLSHRQVLILTESPPPPFVLIRPMFTKPFLGIGRWAGLEDTWARESRPCSPRGHGPIPSRPMALAGALSPSGGVGEVNL